MHTDSEIERINQKLPFGYELKRIAEGRLRLIVTDPDFYDNPLCTCAQRAAAVLGEGLGDYEMSFKFG